MKRHTLPAWQHNLDGRKQQDCLPVLSPFVSTTRGDTTLSLCLAQFGNCPNFSGKATPVGPHGRCEFFTPLVTFHPKLRGDFTDVCRLHHFDRITIARYTNQGGVAPGGSKLRSKGEGEHRGANNVKWNPGIWRCLVNFHLR